MTSYTEGLDYIGRGHFSTVYRKDRQTVIAESRCKVKEIMSKGGFPDCELFPKVKAIAEGVYELPFLDVYDSEAELKEALDPDQWEIYRIIASQRNGQPIGLEYIGDNTARIALFEVVKKYPWIKFDVTAFNVGVGEHRNLVLFDAFHGFDAPQTIAHIDMKVVGMSRLHNKGRNISEGILYRVRHILTL